MELLNGICINKLVVIIKTMHTKLSGTFIIGYLLLIVVDYSFYVIEKDPNIQRKVVRDVLSISNAYIKNFSYDNLCHFYTNCNKVYNLTSIIKTSYYDNISFFSIIPYYDNISFFTIKLQVNMQQLKFQAHEVMIHIKFCHIIEELRVFQTCHIIKA